MAAQREQAARPWRDACLKRNDAASSSSRGERDGQPLTGPVWFQPPLKLIFDTFKLTLAYRTKFPFVDEELDKKLKEAGFSSSAPGHTVLRLSSDGQESVAFRWTGSGSEVYYDPARAFLSAEGNVPESVREAFGKLIGIAKALLSSGWPTEIKWSELYSVIRVLGDRQPLESYSVAYSPKIVERMTKLLGVPVKPFLFAVFGSSETLVGQPLDEVPDWTNIILEPFIQNPKYYFMKVVFRRQDISKVVDFASKLETTAGSVISEIEGH